MEEEEEPKRMFIFRIVDGVIKAVAFWQNSSIRAQIVYSMFTITLAIEAFIIAIMVFNLKIISAVSFKYINDAVEDRAWSNMENAGMYS